MVAIEKKLGYKFQNPALLKQALTHSSYAYEHLEDRVQDNEILEFLGDSVVGLVLADFLRQAYPELGEGQLSKLKAALVSTSSLSILSRKLGLDRAVLLGRGEEKSGGRKKKSILAGTFEAVMGAIYLDSDFETSRRVLQALVKKHFKKLPRDNFQINNFKSALQEYFGQHKLPGPFYRTVTESGPAHDRVFTVEVLSGDKVLARASGPSKKSAEQKAAQKALKKMLKGSFKVFSEEAFILNPEAVVEGLPTVPKKSKGKVDSQP
ncbi:MAG: Ribonuclease III [Candidatus Saccharicenans subterraneus]|uniref:Ribonuclease 3 n=1 Tax=Candidatus Saccharicenans subterraneus TaxID=2508984 RepID=A0A3E2BJM3_9BACT|nr:MAG: Ribonuclease III [Candidatus Saccharicenans subterraneum]